MISGYIMMSPIPGTQALSQCRKEDRGMGPVQFPSTATSMITVSNIMNLNNEYKHKIQKNIFPTSSL